MQDKSAYHYDFSYSLALDPIDSYQLTPPYSPSSPPSLQHSFFDWLAILSSIKIIKQSQENKSMNLSKHMPLIFRLPAFRKSGVKLVKLCGIIHGIIEVEDKDNEIEKCRENIYASWQEILTMLGEDKNMYINTIVLCFFVVVYRVLEASQSFQDQFIIFNTVYWEIKGQLTNKQTMQTLVTKTFNVDLFHKYMYWDVRELQAIYCSQKKATEEAKCKRDQMLTFRSSLASHNNTKDTKINPQMYQSFKQIQQNLLQKKQKQNTNENIIIGVDFMSTPPVYELNSRQYQYPELVSQKMQHKNTDNFRKKQKSNIPFMMDSKPMMAETIGCQKQKVRGYMNGNNPKRVNDNILSGRFQDTRVNCGDGLMSFRENRPIANKNFCQLRRDAFTKY